MSEAFWAVIILPSNTAMVSPSYIFSLAKRPWPCSG